MTEVIYKLDYIEMTDTLYIGFIPGVVATNQELVTYVSKALDELIEKEQIRGKLIKINGAASLPLAGIIVHKLSHLFATVAVFDPKLGDKGKYVVILSHGGLPIGGAID